MFVYSPFSLAPLNDGPNNGMIFVYLFLVVFVKKEELRACSPYVKGADVSLRFERVHYNCLLCASRVV